MITIELIERDGHKFTPLTDAEFEVNGCTNGCQYVRKSFCDEMERKIKELEQSQK